MGFHADDSAPVLFISCYELGHEPLGSLVPAGVLARAGFPVRVIDVAVEELDEGPLRAAWLVCVSVPMHTALRLGVRVAARVREINPTAHICFHGLYAGLNARHLQPDLADTCLGAECESPILSLARQVRAAICDGVPPRLVSFAGPMGVAPAERERELDLAPLRDAPPHPRHARLAIAGELRPGAYVATTRGCRHTCRHCPIPGEYAGAFYAIPADAVARDIDRAVGLGARHVTFADADFLNGSTHALRIARDLHRRHPSLTFDYTAKIEHLLRHTGVVEELGHLGSVFVVSAVESFHDPVLNHLRKGHSRADALEVIRRFRAMGLALRPSLVPFTPWETRASLAELFDIVASEGLVESIDPVQYSIRLLVPEGSLLLQDPSMAGRLGPFDRARLGYTWVHEDPSMDALQPRLAAIAARAAGDTDPIEAFSRMRNEAGGPVPAAGLTRAPGAPPRLTEDWFC